MPRVNENTASPIPSRPVGGDFDALAPIGTTNQVIKHDGTSWVAGTAGGGSSPLTTKGDLYTFSTVDAALGIGANGTVLMADSVETTGNKWIAPGGSSGVGDVVGPASLIDNELVRSDGTSGKLLQGTGVLIDDSGYFSGAIRLKDSTTFFYDNLDNTKLFSFQLSAITTGEIRNIAIPDAGGTLALLSLAQTWSAVQTFVAPVLGAATATSINKITLTQPATGATLTLIDGKTLTINKTISFTSAGDSAVLTVPNATDTLMGLAVTETITGVKTLGTTTKLQIRDTGLFINSSADGQLDISADTTLALTAPTSSLSGTTATNVGTVSGATTIGVAGNIVLGDGTLRTTYPQTDLKMDLGLASSNRFNAIRAQSVQIIAGTSSGEIAKAGGTIYANPSAIGNVGTGEDTLETYTVPANTLSADGMWLHFVTPVIISNSVNAKRIRVKFGATTIFDTGALPISTAIDIIITGWITRAGSSTVQKAWVQMTSNNATVLASADYTAPGETLTGAVILKVTGEAVSNNDISNEALFVSWGSNT